jgi:capsular polysaccharide biosynthesis protein
MEKDHHLSPVATKADVRELVATLSRRFAIMGIVTVLAVAAFLVASGPSAG